MNTATATATDPIVSKIQKLWTTAADPAATPAESATAMRLASRLLMQHRLDETAVRATLAGQQRAQHGTSVDDVAQRTWGPCLGRHDGWLGMAVGAVVDCQTFVLGHRAVGKITVGYGLPADLAVGEAIYPAVTEQLDQLRRERCKTLGIRRPSVQDRSFADGFALALLDRARHEQAERRRSTERMAVATPVARIAAPADEPLAMLPVVIVEGEALDQHLGALEVYGRKIGLQKGRARSIRCDHSSRAAGASAAARVSLSRGLVR